MPVRVIGMIGVTPPSGEATVHVIKGGLSPAYLRAFAQAHDTAGFDLALVSYTASSAEGFLVAQYAAQHTGRLGFLIAHRPGFVAPTLAARKIATFDHLTEGRVAVHIISGASDAEQEGGGDLAPKEERYRRAAASSTWPVAMSPMSLAREIGSRGRFSRLVIGVLHQLEVSVFAGANPIHEFFAAAKAVLLPRVMFRGISILVLMRCPAIAAAQGAV
jgi:hypothetical protein